MESLRALLPNGRTFGRNRISRDSGRDPRRRFVRENRINFEQLEGRIVLANTSADGAFSVLLDSAPGDVNGFDGNLALYQSGLVYNSKTVSDAVVQFAGTLHPVSGNKPDKVSAVFTFPGQSAQTYWWNVDAGANINDDVLFRVPVLSDPLATGGYAWSVDVTYHFGGNTFSPADSTDYSGIYAHVDRSSSEFGKGWYLEDLHELKLVNPRTNPGKVYLITGYGEPTRFDYNGSVYTREPGDQFFYKLTRTDPPTYPGDTYYTLVDKYGTELKFKDTGTTDTSAKLESIFDASGNETRYTYTSGKLSEIKYIPTGDATSFTYSGGVLTTITETIGAVAGVGGVSRSASVSISSGQLTSIALPDPDSGGALAAPVWGFAYSGTTGRITKTTDPVGSTSVFTYGTDGANETIASIKQGVDTSYLTPYNSAKLGGSDTNRGTLKAVEDTFGQFTDERGKITKFEANALGHITKITDDDGNATTFERDETEGWLEKVTTADPDGGGSLQALEITYTHDARGNHLSETKRAAGTTTVLAEQNWLYGNSDYSLPTQYTDELGRVTKYTIGAKSPATNASGKVLSMTQIIGIEDNSNATETDDATTSYTYTTVAGHAGLLSTATDALGRVTTYEYWTTNPHEGLLKKVTYSDGSNVEHEYDDFRNRDAVLDELDHRTEFLFDKLDRMIKRTDADPDAGGGTYVSPETEFFYDASGNLIKTIDPLDNVTRSVYDARNRLAYQIAPRPDNTTAYTHTIDDEDIGFWMTPNWHDYGVGYNGDYRWHYSGAGSDYALWEFGSLDAGKNYEIFVTWPVFGGNATDAPYEILDANSTVLKTLTLDQNLTPADETVASVAWQRLGVFAGSTGYKVKVTQSATGYVGADAVRIVEVGPTVKLEYDAAGNLASEIDPLGNKTTHAYDDQNRRISTTLADPDGAGTGDPAPVYETQYYNNGLVKKQIDALDNETLYEPDTLGRTVKVQAPDPAGGTNYTVTRYTYNPAGEITSMTDPEGRVSFYDYHDSLRQTSVIAAAPGASPYDTIKDDDDSSEGGTTTYQATVGYSWTNDNSATGAYGGDQHYTSDAAHLYLATWSFTGLTVGKEYQVLVTWKADAANATNALFEVWDGGVKETSLRVNQKLAPADWQDIGDNTLWERLIVFKANSTSASVRLWNTGVTSGTIVADAVRVREVGTVARTTHNKVGDVTQTVDGLGNETISLYDRRGRLTSTYEPLRDPNVTPWRPTPVDNPTSSDWTTVSDSRAYGGSYLQANGSSSSYPTYTLGVPSLSYYPTLAVMATWVPDEDNINNALFRVFDNFNNEIGSIYVDQTVAPGDYRDETGRWWAVLGVYQMIPFYTTIKVSPQIGAQADAARLIEVGDRSFKNTYNAAGELTKVTDAKNNDTEFIRDNLGRVKEEKNELNESRYFEFYADSRLKKATDREGRVIEHYFDNLGRQTEERWKNGGATVRSITFGWDANSNLKMADDDGTSARDYDWFYDNLGRLTESEFAASSYTWEFKHGYDGNSNRDSRDLVRSGTTQFSDTFVFDDLNRQTKLTRDAVNWGHDLRAEFDYTAAGQFDEIRRFNVTTGGTAFVTSHYGYDGMGRLTSLDHKNSGGTSITGYVWTYDAAGRMKSMDFTNSTYNSEDVTTFGYDRTNQLLSGDRTGTTDDEAYGYDASGNRTTANGSTYTTTTNNRLTNDGTFTYSYDDEGNRLTRVRISGAAADDKTVEYTWDYRNRLEKVTFKRNDGTVTKTVDLRYDMFNQLTQKVVDPDGALGSASLQTDDYFWDGDELVGVYGYNSLVFASGPAPDMVLFESATTLHALLGDHLNTVRDVIATNGTLENHLVYNSYGELKSQTGGGAYSPFHRFTGKPFDVAVGLQYNVNRWYDPATGRWISEDPIGFGGGDGNLNRYVGNAPLDAVDPRGDQAVKDSYFAGAWRATKNVFWGLVDFVNPFTIDDAFDQVINGDWEEEGKKAMHLLGDPVDYVGNRAEVLYDAAAQQLSTADGRGEATIIVGSMFLPIPGIRGKPGLLPAVKITKNGKVVPVTPTTRINKLQPDGDAVGPHTTFKRNPPRTGPITGYQTWYPQTNPRNPNPWETGVRVDLQGIPHFNKTLGQYVPTPHVHDPSAPGGVRPARPDEIPMRR